MASERGHFITVEGSEGVGKSTNLAFIAEYLEAQGRTVVVTREPGGTPVAERVREILLDARVESISDNCELLLMFAGRADHLEQKIRPALERGDWVLCDRFIDATYAYQGGGRGMDRGRIAELEQLVLGDLRPDLTILLDADPAVTGARRATRGSTDRFEVEQAAFFSRVRAEYQARANQDPQRIHCIDASADLPEVQQRIANLLDEYLKKVT